MDQEMKATASGKRAAKPLRVLVVDDSASDAELMVSALQRKGYAPQWSRVQSSEEFEQALDPALDVLSLFELHFLLKARCMTTVERSEIMAIYAEVFENDRAVDAEIFGQAIVVREKSSGRLPMADALVAGCALNLGATLVCKGVHFQHLSERLVKQIRLS